MKRILILLAAVSMLVSGASAQTRFLVTLSHEGQLTFFDKLSAFEDAINASVDGDVIYLSEGSFRASTDSIEIKNKRISIVGVGYKSYILPDIKLVMDTLQDKHFTAPLFDGVRLEKLTFDVDSAKCVGDSIIRDIEVKKCRIKEISLNKSTGDVLLDRCFMDSYYNWGALEIQIYNSKIRDFYGCDGEILENCNINTIDRKYNHEAYYTVNCIIDSSKGELSGTYVNCLYNTYHMPVTFTSGADVINCYATNNGNILNDDSLDSRVDLSPYLGTDGTVVGVYGGQRFPFSETPSVPTVDAANSSVTYDAENNKLNVTITVAPN